MLFTISRDAFAPAMAVVMPAVERRNLMPILSSVLLTVLDKELEITGTDLEVEVVARAELISGENGSFALPAQKVKEILRALPAGGTVKVTVRDHKAIIQAGRSRFQLSVLSAQDFPSFETAETTASIEIASGTLKEVLDRTMFAMAQSDVRHFLNGVLFHVTTDSLECVATDGHRLSASQTPCETTITPESKGVGSVIVPRKGALLLNRMLKGNDETLTVQIGTGFLQLKQGDVCFATKLIDGQYPDYNAVIPSDAGKPVVLDKADFIGALERSAILSNVQYRSVRLDFTGGAIKISSNNAENEDSVNEVVAEGRVEGIALGCNVDYLMSALGAIKDDQVQLHVRNESVSMMVTEVDDLCTRIVVMPVRL